MIIDDCPAHSYIEHLKARSVFFLTKYTTFITQPMYQGVIRSLKAKYCTIFVRHITTASDNNKAFPNLKFLKPCTCLQGPGTKYQLPQLQTALKKPTLQQHHDKPFSDLKHQLDELARRDSSLL